MTKVIFLGKTASGKTVAFCTLDSIFHHHMNKVGEITKKNIQIKGPLEFRRYNLTTGEEKRENICRRIQDMIFRDIEDKGTSLEELGHGKIRLGTDFSTILLEFYDYPGEVFAELINKIRNKKDIDKRYNNVSDFINSIKQEFSDGEVESFIKQKSSYGEKDKSGGRNIVENYVKFLYSQISKAKRCVILVPGDELAYKTGTYTDNVVKHLERCKPYVINEDEKKHNIGDEDLDEDRRPLDVYLEDYINSCLALVEHFHGKEWAVAITMWDMVKDDGGDSLLEYGPLKNLINCIKTKQGECRVFKLGVREGRYSIHPLEIEKDDKGKNDSQRIWRKVLNKFTAPKREDYWGLVEWIFSGRLI